MTEIASAFALKELPAPRIQTAEGGTSSPERGPLGELVNDQRTVAAFEFYFNRITSGQIRSLPELQARVAQRIDQEGYLQREDRRSVLVVGGETQYISVLSNERFAITDPEQLELLTQLYQSTTNPEIATEIKNLLGVYAKSGKPEDLTRLRNLLEERNDKSAEQIEDFVERFDGQKRRLALRKDFYGNLFEENGVEASFRLIAGFDQQGAEDTSLVIQLRDRALGMRRARVTGDFAAALLQSSSLKPERDFAQVLDILTRLEEKVPGDIECARTLTLALYRFEIATYRDRVREMIKLDTDPDEIYRFINGLPTRADLGGINFLQEAQINPKEKIARFYAVIGKINRLKKANEIRASFSSPDVDSVLQRIEGLPDEVGEEIALKQQLFTLYKSEMASSRPDVFDERFAKDIVSRIEARLKQVFISPELGRNTQAFRYLKRNFDRVFRVLVDSFKDDPRTRRDIAEVLGNGVNDQSLNPKLQFVQKISELEKQRPLTDLERAYLQSVQLLSLFNPYLVAAINADSAVTSEFLRHHFEILSRETGRFLKDGDYVPLLQVGTGPNGMVALGEIVRNNPELAGQVLVIDSGDQPGGPFAIPGGPAWELNSANLRGEGGYILPERPGGKEIKTVRAYGSPLRWYPGERVDTTDVRENSINVTVDYLLTPDVLSTKRYPTNEELQLVLALQTAMLTRRLILSTTLVRVEPNPNTGERGNKIATIKINGKDGSERIVRLKTDAVFLSTGLGEPTYGFKLEGSKAEKVLE